MSIPFSGPLSRSGGLTAALRNQVKRSNLKAVKSVVARYDPWNEENPHASARGFMYHINHKIAVQNNPNCSLTTSVVNDRSEPTVTCNLINGEKVIIKTGNFTTLEVLQLFNKYVSPHGPVPTEATEKKKSKGKPLKK